MKAKISYTVKVEDITSEVQKLLIPSLEILNRLSHSRFQIDDNSLVSSIRQIESIRTSMLEVDTRLQDCYDILVGYNKALSDSFLPQDQEPTIVQEEETDERTDEPVSE